MNLSLNDIYEIIDSLEDSAYEFQKMGQDDKAQLKYRIVNTLTGVIDRNKGSAFNLSSEY